MLVTIDSGYVLAEAKDDSVIPGNANVAPDVMRADLDKLVSSDSDVRHEALVELAAEFASTPTQSNGKYSNYGSALLPVLHRVILDLDNPDARYAVEAIYWMGVGHLMAAQLDRRDLDDAGKREIEQALEKISHYPVPSDYDPMKDALANVLVHSHNSDARQAAAMALAGGFAPVSEIENILATQLPLEEANRKIQSAILGSLSVMADRNPVQRSTELTIIEALASSNMTTRMSAVRVVRRHQFDGALEGVINSMSGASTAYEFDEKLNSISFFKEVDDVHIIGLENVAASIGDEERKKEIQSTIQTLKHRTTDSEHHFGLLELTQSSILLHTPHRGLVPGTRIAVIGSDFVLVVAALVGAERETSTHVRISSRPVASYYVGSLTNNVPVELVENAVVYFALDSPNYSVPSLSHSSCTSNEGIHHSVWSVEGSEKVRVWSAYQYLEYAVDPNCSNDELAEY